ncbi:MAG: 1-hydroxycarotenoid 3,4-desaturase CrtD [Flavobacteriales bacterium]
MNMKVAVIGSGIGGLSSAIRLSKLGYEVSVFEANAFVGGKVNEQWLGNYRFDMGPSVFTEPKLIEELMILCGKNPNDFSYRKLEESCRYFFSDGQQVHMPSGLSAAAQTFAKEFGENQQRTERFLKRLSKNYAALSPVFIQASLHRFHQWCNKGVFHAILRLPYYGMIRSMSKVNKAHFKNPKSAQLLNRMATYNGSSPYRTPGLLNIISHLEFNEGPAMPIGGMVTISKTLHALCLELGVKFYLNERVEEILHQENRVVGIRTEHQTSVCDLVVSNMDVHFTYERLLNGLHEPKKILRQEKSSSAIVFYWGIKRSFPELGVHNIFFAADYKAEFDAIFNTKTRFDDPSIYVHITSKVEEHDAPSGSENWFVMVNAPIDVGQDWDEFIAETRRNCLNKLSKALDCDIEKLIEVEAINEPRKIEAVYFGKQGSIYGNSSNNAFSAFYRHPNFSRTLSGLYFAGVTVHPGGGIPLALNSAKIVERCVREDYLNKK